MKAHDAQQELEYIKQVMKDSRTSIVDNGSGFILWGLLVGLTFLLWYIVLLNDISLNMNIVKLIVFGAGVLLTVVGVVRESRSATVITTSGNFLGAIWIAFLVTLFLTGLLGLLSLPIAAMLLGMACFSSSYAPGFSMFRSIAIVWWLGAILLNILWPDSIAILLFGGMMIAFLALPGFLMYGRFKKEKKKNVVPEMT
jgi:hypothetical protein